MGQRAEICNKIKNPKKAEKKWKKIAGTPATEKRPAKYHSVTPALTAANADEAETRYIAEAAGGDMQADDPVPAPAVPTGPKPSRPAGPALGLFSYPGRS